MSSNDNGVYREDATYDDGPTAPTQPYKAIAAFVITFLGLLVQSLDPSAAHHPVTWQEWLVTIVGALVSAGTVYQVTNPVKRLH